MAPCVNAAQNSSEVSDHLGSQRLREISPMRQGRLLAKQHQLTESISAGNDRWHHRLRDHRIETHAVVAPRPAPPHAVHRSSRAGHVKRYNPRSACLPDASSRMQTHRTSSGVLRPASPHPVRRPVIGTRTLAGSTVHPPGGSELRDRTKDARDRGAVWNQM